jgi:hypothetical protein
MTVKSYYDVRESVDVSILIGGCDTDEFSVKSLTRADRIGLVHAGTTDVITRGSILRPSTSGWTRGRHSIDH